MSTPSPIEQILSQFPGPVTFRSSSSRRMKALAFLGVLGAAALIYTGIMGRGLSTGHPQPDIAGAVVMFLFAALSMALVRYAVIQLRSGWLQLDETGLEMAGYSHRQYLWSDIGDFRVERVEQVGFRVRPPKDDPEALLNLRFTSGRDVWLPDTFGFEPEDLAHLMTAWQSRATKQ